MSWQENEKVVKKGGGSWQARSDDVETRRCCSCGLIGVKDEMIYDDGLWYCEECFNDDGFPEIPGGER